MSGWRNEKKMRSERWRRGINKKVAQMIKSAEGSAGLLHKITEPTAWRGGAQILEKGMDKALAV